MENGKVSVAGGRTIEVCVGEGSSMKGGSIDRGELRTFSLQCDAIPNGMISDEPCDLLLSILVDKNKWVMTRVVGIVLMPSFSRMDDVFIIADRDM